MVSVSIRSLAFAVTLAATVGDAAAVVQPPQIAGKPELEVASGSPARAEPGIVFDRVPRRAARAWLALVADAGADWHATWDVATGVPSRLWGPGVRVPGAMGSPDVAARFARAFLDRHIDL